MEHWERIAELERLDKRSFDFEKKRFDVTGINYQQGKFYIYTLQDRTFVKDSDQFERFVSQIKVYPVNVPALVVKEPVKEEITPSTKTIMNSSESAVVVASVANNIAAVNDALFKQFQQLSGNPTEEDYKKADAMSKMANTMVSVSQTQINFLKLKEKV